MKRLLIFLILMSGCYSNLNYVGNVLPENQRPLIVPRTFVTINAAHSIVDRIKERYFTPEAYDIIKDIPAVDGLGVTPWVAGVNFWTHALSIITLNGIGRKVIVPEKGIRRHGILLFIHEYIHHLDDIDRDGDGEWIDHEEFKAAYLKMSSDEELMYVGNGNYIRVYKYSHIVKEVELKANHWITDTFGIGDMSEHIAYMGHLLVKKGGPDYMWKVYRRILKRY